MAVKSHTVRDGARVLAAEIKSVIAIEGLHVLCAPIGEGGPGHFKIDLIAMQGRTDGRVVLPPSTFYGWTQDAEDRIAKLLAPVLVEAERKSLQDVSTEAMIAELKARADLFFLVYTPNTPTAYDWRRAVKGVAYPLMGFVGMHVTAVLGEMAATAKAWQILDEEVTDDGEQWRESLRDDPEEDGEAQDGGEDVPGRSE